MGVLERSGALITKHYFDIVAFVQPAESGGPSRTDRTESLERLDSFRFLSVATTGGGQCAL